MNKSEGGIKRKSRLAVFEHVTEKKKSPKRTNFQRNGSDLDDDSPSECELVIDDKEEPVRTKRPTLIKISEEPLNLLCEWNFCDERFDSWSKFNAHLADHAILHSEKLKCLWKDCSSLSVNVPLLIQHLSFHGYLSKLKNIGQNVLMRNNLPACRLKEAFTIPVCSSGYTCDWVSCGHNFCSIYEFYTHMEVHIKDNPKKVKENSGQTIICHWNHCNTKYSTQYKLAEHIRTHTKERTVGCPTCCSLFSTKTKFCDHRKRQLSTNLQSYQCSQCLKLFASERLLRDHMRAHINHYKCTMCDMTCTKPSLLAKHIRFKHVKFKPYKCNECGKAFVADHNLRAHLRTHQPEDFFHCDRCDFKCRSQITLDHHHVKAHAKVCPVYECHCCKKTFKRGQSLTGHLMKRHNYHWPSGHSRFRYRKDQDGICRLQTVRYESLEVTQEMIKSESMQTNNVSKGKTYHLRYDNNPQKYVLSISETDEYSVKSTEPMEKTILITINDVDEQGNIVSSEVVESRELIGSVNESDITIAEHPLPDNIENKEREKTVVATTLIGSELKSDIEIVDNPLPDNADSKESVHVGKLTSKESVKIDQSEQTVERKVLKSENIRYFSKEVILNYDMFKIETTK